MKGYENYGRGAYPSTPLPLIDKKLGFKNGIVCSGDSFDEEQIDYKMFLKEHCAAIDMEAASVAWVSMLTKTPMIAIKGITNFVRGEHIHAEHKKYPPVVTMNLAKKLKELLGLL
jgi:nucleoside phosphorylase